MEKRKAIITGSSSGIGKAITSILLKSGADVIGLARDHKKFEPNFDRYFPFHLICPILKKLIVLFLSFCINIQILTF